MRKPKGRPIDGWLLIDKSPGITSARVVARLKRAFDARKVGHAGTLDPIATGVLPIAFGAATKTVPFIMDGTKIYRFTLRLGESRTTDDREGEVLETSAERPTDDALRAALPALTGEIMQVPPAFSALKVAGERAYDMAREGRPPELPPRPARIDRFELIARPDADHAVFEVESGKGVYMRSLARDVARAAGSVGHVAELRRLRCGPFHEADTISLDILEAGAENARASPDLLLPVTTALADIPALALTGEEADRLSNGRPLARSLFEARLPGSLANLTGLVRAMAGERVLGLCRLDEAWLSPERMLQPVSSGE
jgi:tRNA pseudouridine55 synthase